MNKNIESNRTKLAVGLDWIKSVCEKPKLLLAPFFVAFFALILIKLLFYQGNDLLSLLLATFSMLFSALVYVKSSEMQEKNHSSAQNALYQITDTMKNVCLKVDNLNAKISHVREVYKGEESIIAKNRAVPEPTPETTKTTETQQHTVSFQDEEKLNPVKFGSVKKHSAYVLRDVLKEPTTNFEAAKKRWENSKDMMSRSYKDDMRAFGFIHYDSDSLTKKGFSFLQHINNEVSYDNTS